MAVLGDNVSSKCPKIPEGHLAGTALIAATGSQGPETERASYLAEALTDVIE